MDLDLSLEEIMLTDKFSWHSALLSYLAISVVAPFYVACGFCLYINRRTLLEGWDIELVFKNLAQRTGKIRTPVASLVGLALLATISGFVPQPVAAQQEFVEASAPELPPTPYNPTASRKAIIEILEGDVFNNIVTEEQWQLIDDEDDSDQEDFSLLSPEWSAFISRLATVIAQSAEVILWGLILTLIVFLILRYRSIPLPALNQNSRLHPEAPETLFGLDVRKDSLPNDPVAQAQALWQQGHQREAYSLLYRGAIADLLHTEQLPLSTSFTEGECVTFLHQHANVSPEKVSLFSRLTDQWVRLAYGHQLPSAEDFTSLCSIWKQYFAAAGDTDDNS